MDNQDPMQKLRDLLATQEKYHEPWTSGVVNLSGSESTLFFKCKNGLSRSIELGSTTEEDIQALIDACDPATFGRGPEAVLDETYRKAWKLDAGKVSWLFNADSGKFLAQLARGLCPWDSLDRGIRAELSKLNIYGKGGFFKRHQDTPRAENMFGSLVFVLPFEHQGGNLMLHHRARDFTFDAPALLQGTSPLSLVVAYVAFYSDVEHEVLEVTSGHRVTITFNLYFDPFRGSPIVSDLKGKIPENTFITTLRKLFRDAAFVRDRKCLGFGLEYKYPKRADEYSRTICSYETERYLKGPDAFLFKALTDIGLKPKVRYLFRSDWGSCDFWIMLPLRVCAREKDEASHDTELPFLLGKDDSWIVWAPEKSESTVGNNNHHPWIRSYFREGNVKPCRECTLPVTWVTAPTDNLIGRTEWTELGNEPAEEIFYYEVCMIVDTSEVPCPRLPEYFVFS